MSSALQSDGQLTFHRNQRGNIIADDQFNIALAFEKLGIVPTLEQNGMVLKIGKARRVSFPEHSFVPTWKKSHLHQFYKREIEQIRIRIQRECGFLPKRRFLEAVGEMLAREDFG